MPLPLRNIPYEIHKQPSQPRPSPFIKTVNDLAEVSTVHGLRYILQSRCPKRNVFDRVVWAVIVFGVTALGLFMSARMYITWKDHQVTTTIGTASLAITELDFPAITICSPGNDIQSLYKLPRILEEEWVLFSNKSGYDTEIEEMEEDELNHILGEFVGGLIPGWPKNLTLNSFLLHMTTVYPAFVKNLMIWRHAEEQTELPGFDILLNPNKSEQMQRELEEIDAEIQELFKNMDFSSDRAHKVLMAVLWFTGLPCQKLITRCVWKSIDVPCLDVFHMIPTDIGFCCSFHHHPLTDMLRNSKFANIIEDIEVRYKLYENVSRIELPPGQEVPNLDPQAGKHNGLTVVIDTKSFDETIASVQQDFYGVTVAVNARNTFPMMTTNSFLVAPGHVTHVEITGQRTSATKEHKESLSPSDRGCYYDDEFYLEQFSKYTMTNCWVECLMNLSRSAKDDFCHPWNFPTRANPPCKPREQHDFKETFRFLDMNKVIGSELCLPNCVVTDYSTSVTTAPYRPCEQSNIGLTDFCRIGYSGPGPHRWFKPVMDAYRTKVPEEDDLPDYLDRISSPVRRTNSERLYGNLSTTREYDAFDKDIATITFFFSKPVAVELISAPTMTFIDYASNVGGLLGLFIGFSLISAIEILYWLTIGYAENTYESKTGRKISVTSSTSTTAEQKKSSRRVSPVKLKA